MPSVQFKKPCNDCPFRRAALQGWLGGAGPEWFVDSALADYADYGFPVGPQVAPCHKTIDYTDKDWLTSQADDAAACAGALIFARNNHKSPRDPERAKAVASVERDTEDVFATPQEFIEHHRSGEFKSWENADEPPLRAARPPEPR